ncbi:MAG: insulinase family protein, partial [Spirochaetales bacterium]|nr:insulinase family protein [Spirochaetales bacterium]
MIKKDAVIHSFRVLSVKRIKEYGLFCIFARHMPTGMHAVHLCAEDDENVFAFVFKTPPTDSTGLPHILEHSVLCGSTRYPLKKPFMHLSSGSMNTFLNAFTTIEGTAFPGASIVEKDFYNLFSVYGDAVFHPLLNEEIFWQEGFHIDENRITGVVFNEMRGKYSSSENLAYRYAVNSL